MMCSTQITVMPSSVAHLANMADKAPHLGRRQSRRDLIDKQQARPARQCSREFDGLALLQRQAVGAFGELVAKPGEGCEMRGFGQRLRPAEAIFGAEHQWHGHVFQHRQIAERPRNLIGPADPEAGHGVAPQPAQALAGKHDVAADRLVDLGQAVEQRRFAGAVRTDQTQDFAFANLQDSRG